MPAAMAISDQISSDMRLFKEAVLCGMEVAIRLGMWLGRTHYRKGFHITGTAGTFGANAKFSGNSVTTLGAQVSHSF